ncbi:hypothetical protein [Microbacterium candidum]|uniref:Uncharacterized protein n=1 Tax=Microbacterium candidum TaxID=3041922 RepID=A0ABT7N070_9MICO|nr:hypothetical protein [Microbacterium sp. ASV49]MDL9980092.1 hypothetical protein [Microbacterium sp. ASV49]
MTFLTVPRALEPPGPKHLSAIRESLREIDATVHPSDPTTTLTPIGA